MSSTRTVLVAAAVAVILISRVMITQWIRQRAAHSGSGYFKARGSAVLPTLDSCAHPAAGSFDPTAAAQGQVLFNGKAKCSTCHVPPLFAEPGWNMHTPADIGIDDFQSNRSPDKRYRTTPLKGLWAHRQSGLYHDGRFAS